MSGSSRPNVNSSTAALEQTEIPPELFLPFRGLSSVPLFFSDYCRKLTTHKGVTITRVIICTCEHFYLCHPNGDILRCFPFTAISKIFHDEFRNQVGIVVPCEFDVAVETPLSFQLIRVLDVLRRMHGARNPLQLIRVEPVPRPEGFLGLRPDGSTIWDPRIAKIHNRKNEQSCTDQVLGFCGLQNAWIACKDASYRYYRRVMRSLDLGIEDDDEILTNTTAMSTAMMANNANSQNMNSAVAGGGGGDGNNNNNNSGNDPTSSVGGINFTVMLAAGKTSFAFAKSFASRASFVASGKKEGSSGGENGKDGNNNNTAEDDPNLPFGMPQEEMQTGYRWFRPSEEDLKKKKEEDEERRRKKKNKKNKNYQNNNDSFAAQNTRTHFSDDPEDNEVLNMLLSPMMGEHVNGNGNDDDENNSDSDNEDDDGDGMIGRLAPRRMKTMFDEEGNLIETDDVDGEMMIMMERTNQSNKKDKKKKKKKVQNDSNLSNLSSSNEQNKDANRDQWWPGCQVGWSDGPYALSLAKPKGFKVALDQKNSEFV